MLSAGQVTPVASAAASDTRVLYQVPSLVNATKHGVVARHKHLLGTDTLLAALNAG